MLVVSVMDAHLYIKQNVILPMLQILIDRFLVTANDRKWLAFTTERCIAFN